MQTLKTIQQTLDGKEGRMSDRFDLEQAILRSDLDQDLNLLFERYCDGPVMSEDDMSNALLGLITINRLRHDHLWKVFEGMLHKRCIKDADELLMEKKHENLG